MVYDRTVNGQVLDFGNTSALYESDMVMVDHQTGSYWVQVTGQAVVGELTGQQMGLLPAQTTTWELWKVQHPDTLVLSRDTGFSRDYNRDNFANIGEIFNETGQFFFPVSENGRDSRLQPGEVVVGVEVGNAQRGYPIERLGDGVINDHIGDHPIVIFSSAKGPTGAAYSSVLDDKTLTFIWDGQAFIDTETNSSWSLSGQATTGSLTGAQLEPLPMRSTFWFSLAASFPGIELYELDEN
ncbi:MAG: DUF3179 domain-containing (seleno)protein [Chloroflexota bacterium]